MSGNRVDVIVNCAAYTAVDKAEDNPELCDKLNHIAPGYLAAAAEACGAAMIQVSTDYVSMEPGIFLIRKTLLLVPTPSMVPQSWQASKRSGRNAVVP